MRAALDFIEDCMIILLLESFSHMYYIAIIMIPSYTKGNVKESEIEVFIPQIIPPPIRGP